MRFAVCSLTKSEEYKRSVIWCTISKKQHAKKNTKATKESPKAEEVKPVENNNVGGEMKTRIIQ